MRASLALLPLLSATLILTGCVNDNAPRKALADAVHSMNDAARWGRIGTAVAMVDLGYQPRFLEAHRTWGETVQLADSEVLQVDMPTEDVATAVVAYSWYNLSTMTLHNTVVQQQWVRKDDAFILASEAVIKGDVDLFAPARKPGDGATRADAPG